MANRMTIHYDKKPCYDIVFTNDFELLVDELQAFDVENRRVRSEERRVGKECM